MSAWEYVALGELGGWTSGGTPKRSIASNFGGNIPWAATPDLNGSYVSATREHLTQAGLQSSAAKVYPVGTILISMYGSIGKLGITAVPMASSQALAAFTPDTALIDTTYALHVLFWSRPKLNNLAKGGTQKNISQSILKSLKVPLPPLDEQRRIAEALDTAANCRNRLQTVIEEAARISTISTLGPGETIPLGEVVTARSGTVDPTTPENRNYPHVAPDNIKPSSGQILNVKSAREDAITSGKYHFKTGDVLYSKIRPYLNKVSIAPFDGLCSADMYALKPKEGFSAQFVAEVLRSDSFLGYAEKNSGRASIPKINRKALLSFPVPVAAPEVRSKISTTRLLRDDLIKQYQNKQQKLEELYTSLATRAFAGEL